VSERIFNFSAGPAVLPEPVLHRAQEAIWNLAGSGIGIMEHSHRGPQFEAVLARAEALLRELGRIPDDFDVLFLQGGASLQFAMVPMNFLSPGRTADYLVTGVWGQKAVKEAKRYGTVHIAASTEAERFTSIPSADAVRYSDNPVYVHFTSNNTVYGTQWRGEPPGAPAPLVCDASSDIFSKPIDVARYGLIYAGAQKNLGPSGLTVVIVKKSMVAAGNPELATMLQYRTYAAEQSMFNTPPTFAIFVLAEVLAWLKEQGGLEAAAERNSRKARLVYDFLDRSELFRGTVRADSRSLMNVVFRVRGEDPAQVEALEKRFIAEATRRGLDGLKGHRSVGGMRASMYNAFPEAGAAALVAFMQEFEREIVGATSGPSAGS
jgi:phosphoserine aminotransferase